MTKYWRSALFASITAIVLIAGEGAAAPPDNSNGGRHIMLAHGDNNIIRTGPGNEFAIAAMLPKGATFPVIAKKGDWNGIELTSTETGWVHSSLCYEYQDLSDLEFRPNPRLFSRIGSYYLSGWVGGYSFDRKSNSIAAGGRIGYYVLDFLEVDGGVAWTHVERPAEIVESLFDLSLEAEEFHMLFYDFNLNLKLLPGRRLVPYLTAGVGSSIFRGETEASTNFGGGAEFFVARKTAMRWDVRTYRFPSGDAGARRDNDNWLFSLGTITLF